MSYKDLLVFLAIGSIILFTSCHRDKVTLEAEYSRVMYMTVYNIRIDGDYEFSTADKKEADSVYKLVLQYGRAWDDVKPDSIVVLKEEKRPMEFRP